MEDIIMQEAAVFKDHISEVCQSGAPVAVPKLFLEMVNCVLWRIVSGRAVDAAVRKQGGNSIVIFWNENWNENWNEINF